MPIREFAVATSSQNKKKKKSLKQKTPLISRPARTKNRVLFGTSDHEQTKMTSFSQERFYPAVKIPKRQSSVGDTKRIDILDTKRIGILPLLINFSSSALRCYPVRCIIPANLAENLSTKRRLTHIVDTQG